MNITIIIVTKDRPQELERCVHSIKKQTTPPQQVIVVDAKFISSPGITKQRNIGRAQVAANTDVVLYLDDDTELSSTAVQQISDFFSTHRGAVGLTGTITGEKPAGALKRWLGCCTGLYTNQPYAITFGLFNSINFAARTQAVEWLPGAFMAYRWSKVKDIPFDEWFTGYGLGEDLEFSLRTKAKGPLYVDPSIIVQHHHSSRGRDWQQFGYMRIVNRAYILKKHFFGRPTYWCGLWWANLCLLAGNSIRALWSVRYRQELLGELKGIQALSHLLKIV